jgi:V8-like Glu-specific endopeptidase
MFYAMIRAALAIFRILPALLLYTSPACAIMGGAGSDPNTLDSPWAGVGSITVRNGGIYSGALIGPRHVLTAAHAVAGIPDPAADITFNLNYGGRLSHRFRARAVHILPGFQGARPGPGGVWFGDMAVVELAENVPKGVPIYEMYTLPSLGLPRDTTLTLVGYGAHGDGFGELAAKGDPGVKRVGQNRLEAQIGQRGSSVPEVFVFGFDAPPGGPTANAAPRALHAEAGFAGGDSGSPVFVLQDHVWKILGIATFNAGTPASRGSGVKFGAIDGGTFVAPHMDWIESVLRADPKPSVPEEVPTGAPAPALPEMNAGVLILAGLALLIRLASLAGSRTGR